MIIFSFLHHHYIWKKCTVGFLDNKWVNEIFLTHKSNVPKISARLCCVKSIKLAKIMNFLKRKSPKRSSALFRMKVNKVSRFFYLICYLQNWACVNFSNIKLCMQNIWWLILGENSLVCKSNVVQVPFWEMLYKGKPQNLQYSRVVVASLDAYPTFFPFVSFHLNEIKSQKHTLRLFCTIR